MTWRERAAAWWERHEGGLIPLIRPSREPHHYEPASYRVRVTWLRAYVEVEFSGWRWRR